MFSPPLFQIDHPLAKDSESPFFGVYFILRGLNTSESISLLPLTENGRTTFVNESFIICCQDWHNISHEGQKLECSLENKRLFANHPKNYHLLNYLLHQTDTRSQEKEKTRIENLDLFLHLETGEAKYEKESREHGIEIGMLFQKLWCCQTPDNIWDQYGDEPPCEVCPKKDFTLSPLNAFVYQRWMSLDYTGRNRGMQEEPLNEPSIDAHLTRYQCNTPLIYESLLRIETTLFSARMRKREKERKKEEKAQARMQQNTHRKR